jgi:branched-chain amino acid transport system permease protein
MGLHVSGAFPSFLHWTTSGEAILVIMPGGITVFPGPLAGTALLLLLSDRITNITGHHGLVLGTLLLAIVLGLRKGLLDFAAENWRERRGEGRA